MPEFIPTDILKEFLTSFENEDVWQVHQSGKKSLTVFFYKDSQIAPNRNLPVFDQMKDGYLKLANQYLDLNLLGTNDIIIHFDSKENFETKYEANWYDYYH
jgi:hypothetical protein